ncbi:YihY family inner membrane protein [Arcobacter sp. FWKO B]|uniref:YihY family inner membrane protein n=1 Tax=Arcobacter sp. FWKO B TaxID=2593672 RepID=UPI001D1842F1|nr:YhjD/YihY/BrkB family envelope integrity protein [Arcobacter sp. FWKO B]
MINFLKKVYEFVDDDTPYYAASLSFFTIFALLPIIALIIWFVSSMEFLKEHSELLLHYLLDLINPIHSERINTFINNFLVNSDSLGSIGIIYLIFVFTMFFKDYEYIVNKIHNVPNRPLYQSMFVYLLLLLIIPIIFGIFIFSISFTSDNLSIKVLTFLFIWVLFMIIFKISINRKISLIALLSSSFITLTALTITKSLFIQYILLNTTYTTLYGSFSAILFFILWIYISWIIYLYGMKLCHTINTKEIHKV